MFNQAAAIGVDIGRNTIKIAVVKIHGEVIAAKSYPLDHPQSRDYIIAKLLQAIREIRQTVAPGGVNPICVGTAAKGFIDHNSGIVIGPDQGIEGWTNVPLAKIINQEIGLPAYVGNDANMMTIAEHRFGAARGFNNIIFVALRTGIGGGMSEANDSYLRMIKESAFSNSLENCRSEVKIERAHLGSSASLLGSAYYGMTRLTGKSI